MTSEPDGEDLHEQVLRAMVAAVPEPERPAALRALLDALEGAHREQGIVPPPWIARLRARLDG